MEEETQAPTVNVADELARKDAQLERLRVAYLELQQQLQFQQQQQQQQQPEPHQLDRVYKNVAYLPVFTGSGDITINSFLSSAEYLLSNLQEEQLKKEATKAIFYRNIQGEAKNVIINIQQPDNWQLIKRTLKLKYRPNMEPHQIYRRINELRVNTVSELAVELQNLKYKSDEISIYYREDQCIDLSNVDSLLTNIAKEMTQGTLLDKIYSEKELGTIIDIMMRRRYEDSCIRQEFRKFRANNSSTFKQANKYNNPNPNYNKNQNYQNKGQGNFNFRPNNKYNNNNRPMNNSGQYRQNNNFNGRVNNFNRFSNSGNFQRFTEAGHPGPNSNQNRWNHARQSSAEPMEVDNIQMNSSSSNIQMDEVNYNEINQINNNNQKTAELGNPRTKDSQ